MKENHTKLFNNTEHGQIMIYMDADEEQYPVLVWRFGSFTRTRGANEFRIRSFRQRISESGEHVFSKYTDEERKNHLWTFAAEEFDSIDEKKALEIINSQFGCFHDVDE